MSFISPIADRDASAALTEAYAEVSAGRGRGRVANVFRIHGVHPAAMVSHARLYHELMFGQSPLSRIERETIAVAVSWANGCRY